MKRTHRFLPIAGVLIAALVFAAPALAHPLGNFTINHYAELHVSKDAIQIDYILDMAEIPAFQEIAALDTNGNNHPDPDETPGYASRQCEMIRTNLALQIENHATPLELNSSAVEFPPGAGGLATLRLNCGYQAKLSPQSEPAPIAYADSAYSERLGWHEIVVIAEGVSLQGDFATQSVSRRLTSYPQDMLQSPLDQRSVSFKLASTGGAVPGVSQANPSQPAQKAPSRGDTFTRLITLDEVTLPGLLLALAISFVWGAMHAMTPGHGKTIVAAYLVGSRGTPQHALYLGLTTTITHTAGVFALGLVTLFASHFIFPERLFPWLSFLSGLLVVGIGVNLFISRLRAARHPHSHNEPHLHDQYSHGNGLEHTQEHDHTHEHDHHHDHQHEHGHSHLPPGADGAPVTWRSLLALGISGGILPCPSALVVLLSAIALGRVGFGLVLVSAFSLGLAGVLTGTGLVLVYAGRWFKRLSTGGLPLLRLLPAASALFIAVIGLGITAKALIDIGLLKL